MKYFTVRYPTSADSPRPNANSPRAPVGRPWAMRFIVCEAAAARIAGIPRRNENLAARSRFSPNIIAMVSTAPDLDTPGISATACAKPSPSASVVVNDVSVRSRVPQRSATIMTTAPSASATPATAAVRTDVDNTSAKSSPTTKDR